jgi:hypothetical protein
MTKYILAFFFLFRLYTLQAQQYLADSVLTTSPVEYAKHIYHTRRGEESALYNGINHEGYSASIEGHAYFQSPDWQNGSVIYDHILYENIIMKYDLLKDQLIVTPKEKGGMSIALFSPRVERFSFSTFNFIRINKPGTNSSPSAGFYQQLVQGKLTALSKRTKMISERIEDRTVLRKFEETVKFYLLKDGIYYPVRNKEDILTAVKDRRKDVQQFLSGKELKYRKDPEKTIIAVAEFYNQSSQ